MDVTSLARQQATQFLFPGPHQFVLGEHSGYTAPMQLSSTHMVGVRSSYAIRLTSLTKDY